jgi:hypothetical protein
MAKKMNNEKVYVFEGGDGFNGFNIFMDCDCTKLDDQYEYDDQLDITEQQNRLAEKIKKNYSNAIFCGDLKPYNK